MLMTDMFNNAVVINNYVEVSLVNSLSIVYDTGVTFIDAYILANIVSPLNPTKIETSKHFKSYVVSTYMRPVENGVLSFYDDLMVDD